MIVALIKKIIIILTFFAIVCTIARSSHVPARNPASNIHDKVGKILKTCFAEQLTALVVSSDLSEAVYEMSSNEIQVPIILIEKNFENQWGHRNMPRWPTFVLSANSGFELTTVLQQLKSTAYWKIYAKFFIVGNTRESCQKASEILYSAWKMNLVSVFYVCNSLSQGASLYTSNPFTDRAPKSWKKVKNDGRWTLYVRRNLKGKFCIDMNWDRTKSLDGYEVNAVANTKYGEAYHKNKTYGVYSMMNKIYLMDWKIFISIWEKMNVTVSIHYDEPGYFMNGTAVGFLPKLLDGTYDIAPVLRPLSAGNSMTNSTPQVAELNFVILTRHRNFLRPEEKIVNFYTKSIIILILGVLVITWLIFVLANRGQITSAALEVVRMIVNTSLLQRLDKTPMRIYLFGVLWLLLILSATFQGNLSSFLTKPERHDVDTLEDVESLNYHVYVPYVFKYFTSQPQLKRLESKGNMYIVKKFDCIPYILNDSSGACLQGKLRSIESAMKYNLHISKILKREPGTYWQRMDWPLSIQSNLYLSRLIQSGLVESWSQKSINADKLTDREEQTVAPQIRKIKLDDLAFAFKILAIGYALSLSTFVLELALKKRRQIMQIFVHYMRRACQDFHGGYGHFLQWFRKLKFRK